MRRWINILCGVLGTAAFIACLSVNQSYTWREDVGQKALTIGVQPSPWVTVHQRGAGQFGEEAWGPCEIEWNLGAYSWLSLAFGVLMIAGYRKTRTPEAKDPADPRSPR